MKILISTLVTFGYISAIIGVVSLILLLIKKSTYYSSNRQEEILDKMGKLKYIAGIFITISTTCFLGSKELIKQDFRKALNENKVISTELDDTFFSQDDMKSVFRNFESTEGRFRCEHYSGFINFESGENIPIEVFRHCYEKNRYIIISKKYSIDATIGDIRTSAFDFIKSDSITSQ